MELGRGGERGAVGSGDKGTVGNRVRWGTGGTRADGGASGGRAAHEWCGMGRLIFWFARIVSELNRYANLVRIGWFLSAPEVRLDARSRADVWALG